MVKNLIVPISMVTLLFCVLLLDFMLRRIIYNRSDPISFSMLGYSFLLIVANLIPAVLRAVTTREIGLTLLVAASVYLVLVPYMFSFAKIAHMNFQDAQEKVIRDYLTNLRDKVPTSDEGLWRALEELGASAIEPDLFVMNLSKQRKRIEYLRLVKQLTNATIDPIEDEEKLLVKDGRIRVLARIAYITIFLFALLSTLFFFSSQFRIT